jgi:hypothetical protein
MLLLVGYTALGLLVVDRYLQYTEKEEVLEVVARLAAQEAQIRSQLLEKHRSSPCLYRASVTVPQHRGMGGTHGIRGTVRAGDVLDVLQEGVGPNGLYLLVRTLPSSSAAAEEDSDKSSTIVPISSSFQDVQVGWYPRAYVERVKEPPTIADSVGTMPPRRFGKWLRWTTK